MRTPKAVFNIFYVRCIEHLSQIQLTLELALTWKAKNPAGMNPQHLNIYFAFDFTHTILMRYYLQLSVLFISLILGCNHICSQTIADARLAEILNSGDLFLLKAQYPSLKDSVRVKMLRLVAEAQLGCGFNRLESAATALDSLCLHHQEELGDAATAMASLRAMTLLNLGRYAQAGKAGEELVNKFKDVAPFESIFSYFFIERIGKALADTPASYMERPDRDITVPLKCDSAGRGYHFHIPVTVNGITKDYVLDTGCSFGNFVSEKYAKEVGLRILSDSIPVLGVEIGFVKLATADSLQVGEIIHHNPIFMVAPPDQEVDSIFTFDGVLGYHFIRDVKEIIIDNASRSFIFPYRISDGESNMFLSGNTPQIRIEYDGKPFDIVFDTGNVKSRLGNAFARMFPEAVSGLTEHQSRYGGFGGVSYAKVVTLPKFRFSCSGQPVTLHQTEVLKDSINGPLFSGSLGTDFVSSFKRFVINYEQMFIRGEQ